MKVLGSMVLAYMGKKLTIIANIIILYSTMYIISIMQTFDDWATTGTPRYRPKSKQWKRLNEGKQYLSDKALQCTKPILAWMSNYEEDWHEFYRARVPQTRKRKRKCCQHPSWRVRQTKLYGMETLIINSTTNSRGEEIHENRARFDTDSGRVGVDNRASACISDDIGDFIGPLTKVNRAIKGFGGERVMNVYKGTICWKWNDNDGETHRFVIPNSYYVPQGKCRLLSPQH